MNLAENRNPKRPTQIRALRSGRPPQTEERQTVEDVGIAQQELTRHESPAARHRLLNLGEGRARRPWRAVFVRYCPPLLCCALGQGQVRGEARSQTQCARV